MFFFVNNIAPVFFANKFDKVFLPDAGGPITIVACALILRLDINLFKISFILLV